MNAMNEAQPTVLRRSIEVSTLGRPHIPFGSEPSRDDDQTGVRALLSSLPEPDPMPEHLVRRINASLAAEQAERAAKTSGASVAPLLPAAPRRARRVLFALVGAAAAVTAFAAVGSNLLSPAPTTTAARSEAASTSSSGRPATQAPRLAAEAPAADGDAVSRATPPLQIVLSGTRYTEAEFVTQARAARRVPVQQGESSVRGPALTPSRLSDCLLAIGAVGADTVWADVALYQGQRAVIIVAITKGRPIAYVVRPTCSRAGPAVLRPATPLS